MPFRHATSCPRSMLVAAFLWLAAGGAPLRAQQKNVEEIAGTWVIDVERSDDARRKLRESVEPDGGASRRRRGAGGVILGGRGEARAGINRARIEGPPPAFVDAWIESVSRIALERANGTIILHREGRDTLVLVPDDRDRAIETADVAEPILRKARWDGHDLIVETKLGKAVRIEEKYDAREEDGRVELRVETKISGDRVPRSIEFRRVYTRASTQS